eukprot:scaffold11864_cov76-Phaeocystis_antarctica.AAC.1
MASSSSASVLLVAKFITSSPSTFRIFCIFFFTESLLKPSITSGLEVALYSPGRSARRGVPGGRSASSCRLYAWSLYMHDSFSSTCVHGA